MWRGSVGFGLSPKTDHLLGTFRHHGCRLTLSFRTGSATHRTHHSICSAQPHAHQRVLPYPGISHFVTPRIVVNGRAGHSFRRAGTKALPKYRAWTSTAALPRETRERANVGLVSASDELRGIVKRGFEFAGLRALAALVRQRHASIPRSPANAATIRCGGRAKTTGRTPLFLRPLRPHRAVSRATGPGGRAMAHRKSMTTRITSKSKPKPPPIYILDSFWLSMLLGVRARNVFKHPDAARSVRWRTNRYPGWCLDVNLSLTGTASIG
jgi:hypothetical protein